MADHTEDNFLNGLSDHYLGMVINDGYPPRISGDYTGTSGKLTFKEYGLDVGVTTPTIHKRSRGDFFPPTSTLALMARANANPNRPAVDLPLFLFELREIPGMLRHIGNWERSIERGGSPTSQAASTYLSLRFGWGPLVSDLAKLLDLSELIEQRARELDAARKGMKIQRTLLKTETTYDLPPKSFSICGTTAFFKATVFAKAWYSTKLQCDEKYFEGTTSEREAFRAALGLTRVELSTIWNALPWTWLIDYFSSFGVFLSAFRGGIPFKVGNFNIMTNMRVVKDAYWVGGLKPTDGTVSIYETKHRDISAGTGPPGFYWPTLSSGQIAILGSLFLSGSSGRSISIALRNG